MNMNPKHNPAAKNYGDFPNLFKCIKLKMCKIGPKLFITGKKNESVDSKKENIGTQDM